MSDNIVSILQKRNQEPEAVFINDNEFAERFCNGLNRLLGYDYVNYELTDFHVEGKTTDGVDKISLIMENGVVIKVYINSSEEAQKDFDRLQRYEDFAYVLISDFEEFNMRKGENNEN